MLIGLLIVLLKRAKRQPTPRLRQIFPILKGRVLCLTVRKEEYAVMQTVGATTEHTEDSAQSFDEAEIRQNSFALLFIKKE